MFTEFDFLDDELDKESEDMSSFGWTSTTELGKGESLENLRNMPSPSRSGSEEELREIISKDEEMSDEEESEVLCFLIYLQNLWSNLNGSLFCTKCFRKRQSH